MNNNKNDEFQKEIDKINNLEYTALDFDSYEPIMKSISTIVSAAIFILGCKLITNFIAGGFFITLIALFIDFALAVLFWIFFYAFLCCIPSFINEKRRKKALKKIKTKYSNEFQNLQKKLDIKEEKLKLEYQKLTDYFYAKPNEYILKYPLPDSYDKFYGYTEYLGLTNNSIEIFTQTPIKKYVRFEIEITGNSGGIQVQQSFKLDDIFYFDEKGSISYSTKVSGGGSSVGGAVVGGVLAGGAGAVIGSRKGISSETIEHDTRKTVLATKNGTYEYPYAYYDIFCKLIPEKEYKAQQIQK